MDAKSRRNLNHHERNIIATIARLMRNDPNAWVRSWRIVAAIEAQGKLNHRQIAGHLGQLKQKGLIETWGSPPTFATRLKRGDLRALAAAGADAATIARAA